MAAIEMRIGVRYGRWHHRFAMVFFWLSAQCLRGACRIMARGMRWRMNGKDQGQFGEVYAVLSATPAKVDIKLDVGTKSAATPEEVQALKEHLVAAPPGKVIMPPAPDLAGILKGVREAAGLIQSKGGAARTAHERLLAVERDVVEAMK